MTYLSRIFDAKVEEVRERSRSVPLSDLRSRAEDAEPPRGFLRALRNADRIPALIAEVKKTSPSQGLIRPDFDPAAIAATYREAGAHCLSVLTDERFFQGSAENLVLARRASGLPVLRKDFLLDAYQVWEARAMGADAVLLIAAMLEPERLAELHALAKELGMDVLVEVHDEDDSARAEACRPDLVGINNRNLHTFETDLAATERLAPQWSERALLVSESALEGPEDVQRVAAAGARAVLIGTAFCRAADIGGRVREVMGW
ncbi:MAG: indole-3-glycerol phosphate synthase TrpC [Fimbriimonadales bacterium]|nr:indole-3-glycerol phosphate synthase TrpC [Fimbriimonadales bacterium]